MVCRWQMIVLTVGLMLAVPCTAQAVGLLPGVGSAYNDGNGPDAGAWRGYVNFDVPPVSPPFFNDEVEGTLEFAVFLAADFENFLVANSLPVPNPPVSGLVYAYQLDIIAAAPGVEGFTVGIDTDDPRDLPAVPYIPLSGDENPSLNSDQDTSLLWGFQQNLAAGETSAILYFTSPNRPEPDTAQVPSGLASANLSEIPSPGPIPVPEPSTLALIIMGILTVACCLRRTAQKRGPNA